MANDVTWYCLSCKVVVKKLVDNVGKLTMKCSEIEKNVSELHTEVVNIKEEQKENFKMVDEKMASIGEQLESIMPLNEKMNNLAAAYVGLENSIVKLEEDIKNANDRLNMVEADSHGPDREGAKGLTVTNEIVNEVNVQIQSKKDRENSIIVFNVVESEASDSGTRKEFDLSEIIKIASVCGIKLVRHEVTKLFRLGKKDQNKRRPLLVSFSSLEIKRNLMKNLSKLRDQSVNVTVDHDMTPEERRLNQKLYMEAKRLEEENPSGEWIYWVRAPPGGRRKVKLRKSLKRREKKTREGYINNVQDTMRCF